MAMKLTDFPMGFDPEQYKKDAEKIGEEVGAALGNGMVNGLYKTDISITRAFQTQYTKLNYLLEFGIIDQEEYFNRLASIRDRYFSKNSQEWYRYTMEIYEYKVGMLEAYEEALAESLKACAETHLQEFSEIADGAEEMLTRIKKARDAYEESLNRYAGSSTGFDVDKTIIHNYYPTGDPLVIIEYELSDIDEEITRLKTFSETIEKLKERGESLDSESFRAFYEELRTLSIEDANILANLLLQAEDKEFLEYLHAFRERRALASEIADTFYADDFTEAEKSIKEAISQEFSEIPDEFFTYGAMTAENFKEGFIAEIQTLFEDVAQLLQLESFPIGAELTENKTSTTYAPTYNLYQSGETIAQQLISASNNAKFDRLRYGI